MASSHLPLGLDALHLARRLLPDTATAPQRQADPHVGEPHAGERQDVCQHHQHHSVSGEAGEEAGLEGCLQMQVKGMREREESCDGEMPQTRESAVKC